MKDELQSKLVEILGSIQTAAGKAGDFAMTQLPDVAQQYVTYGRAYTAAIALVAVAMFCSGFLACWRVARRVAAADKRFAADMAEFKRMTDEEKKRVGYSYQSEPYRSRYFEASDAAGLQYLPFVLGGALFLINLQQTLLVWFAPKVWLLKEIAGLIK